MLSNSNLERATCFHLRLCLSLARSKGLSSISCVMPAPNSFLCLQGRTLEVLVEGVNPRNPAQAFGRIRHNKLVFFDGDGAALRGRLVWVRIQHCNAYSLMGTLTDVVDA